MTISFQSYDSGLFEVWYPEVKTFTPVSEYFAISEEAKALIHSKTFQSMLEVDPYYGCMHDAPNLPRDLNETQILHELGNRLDEILKGREMFFRTNLFSPKDVKRKCFVSSGKEALELLFASRRMCQGFGALRNREMYMVLREIVHFQEEFRCFVEAGRIKAISQYSDSDSVAKGLGTDDVYSLKDDNYMSLYRYLENVIEASDIQYAVVDIGITPNGFEVIELNPFESHTDKCLFAGRAIYDEKWERSEIRYWTEEYAYETLFIQDRKIMDRELTKIEEGKDMGMNAFIELLQTRLVTTNESKLEVSSID